MPAIKKVVAAPTPNKINKYTGEIIHSNGVVEVDDIITLPNASYEECCLLILKKHNVIPNNDYVVEELRRLSGIDSNNKKFCVRTWNAYDSNSNIVIHYSLFIYPSEINSN